MTGRSLGRGRDPDRLERDWSGLGAGMEGWQGPNGLPGGLGKESVVENDGRGL